MAVWPSSLDKKIRENVCREYICHMQIRFKRGQKWYDHVFTHEIVFFPPFWHRQSKRKNKTDKIDKTTFIDLLSNETIVKRFKY